MNRKQESDELDRLRKQLRILKGELAHEKLKSSAYLDLIRIVEDDFKIPIRKKSGAKPSKK